MTKQENMGIMLRVRRRIQTLFGTKPPVASADMTAQHSTQTAALQARLSTQDNQLKILTKQRDVLKADLAKTRVQNTSLQLRVSTFISDYTIFLLEKLNRLDRLVDTYDQRDVLQDCDLIVAHHFDSLQTALALKTASQGRIKVLFDCVEHPVHTLRTPGKLAYYFEDNPVRDAAHQVLNDDMIRQCDGIVYTSPGHGEYLQNLSVPTQLVYNTKEAATQTPSTRSLRADTGAQDGDHVVMFLNHVYPQGGFDAFMDMAGALETGFKFGFLGIIRDDAWAVRFPELCADEYADRLVQLDMERPNRIVDYVSQADCVLCSFDASHAGYAGLLPIRFFDALMAGVPIVAPETSQAGQIVAQYGVGVVYKEGAHLAAVRAACEMKKTASFQTNSAHARSDFGWDAASVDFMQAVTALIPDVVSARAVILANKPLLNHSRLRNFARALQVSGARTDVVGLDVPDDELKIDGVTYHALMPK